jgi:hypothetical protein
MKMLVYNPDERLSAKQALSHPYFKDLVEQEAKMGKASLIGFNQMNLMKSFHNGNDSQSDIKRYLILLLLLLYIFILNSMNLKLLYNIL